MSCKQFDAYYDTVPSGHPISPEAFSYSVDTPSIFRMNPLYGMTFESKGTWRWTRPMKTDQHAA